MKVWAGYGSLSNGADPSVSSTYFMPVNNFDWVLAAPAPNIGKINGFHSTAAPPPPPGATPNIR